MYVDGWPGNAAAINARVLSQAFHGNWWDSSLQGRESFPTNLPGAV